MWVRIDKETERMEVPGGWIVRSTVGAAYHVQNAVHQIFVADSNHTWRL